MYTLTCFCNKRKWIHSMCCQLDDVEVQYYVFVKNLLNVPISRLLPAFQIILVSSQALKLTTTTSLNREVPIYFAQFRTVYSKKEKEKSCQQYSYATYVHSHIRHSLSWSRRTKKSALFFFLRSVHVLAINDALDCFCHEPVIIWAQPPTDYIAWSV